MKKYLNDAFAKKLLITGGVLYGISMITNLVTVSRVYGKVNVCLDKTPTCTLSSEQIVGKIAMFIGYAGIGIFFAGLVVLIIISVRKKRR